MLKNFEELIHLLKKEQVKKIAVAMAEDEDIIIALEKARKANIASAVLTGKPEIIRSILEKLQIDQKHYEIIPAQTESECVKKAVNEVRGRNAHVLMKGLCSTSVFLKGVLNKEEGLRTGNVLSHLAVFESENYHKLFMVTDAAMNISPDLNTKLAILDNALNTAHKLGYEIPKVAVVAAVEKVNYEQMPGTVDAAIISKMNERKQIKNTIIDGPLAIDNALSKESCDIKGISSPVCGDADILLVPNIETGNACYKILTVIARAKVAGIVVGAAAPIVLTSRSDSDEAKFLSIVAALKAS